MKKRVLLAMFILSVSIMGMKAQYVRVDEGNLLQPKKYEVGVDALNTIFLSTPIIHFDYLFNEDMSFGARGIIGLKDSTPIAIQPNLKWYFLGNSQSTTKYCSGLFLELNAIAGTFPKGYTLKGEMDNKEGSFGVGFGLGYKYVNRSDWSLQTAVVVSRLLSNTKNLHQEAYGTFIVSIAKRF